MIKVNKTPNPKHMEPTTIYDISMSDSLPAPKKELLVMTIDFVPKPSIWKSKKYTKDRYAYQFRLGTLLDSYSFRIFHKFS